MAATIHYYKESIIYKETIIPLTWLPLRVCEGCSIQTFHEWLDGR